MRRFDMYVPENQTDLLQYLDKHQTGIQLIANGSDLINRIQRKQVEAKLLVDLSGLTELSYVKKDGDVFRIGAMTTIAELAASPILDSKYEGFREVAATFGGPSILNVATVGGNICSASSSEDLLPLLLVLDSEVRLRSTKGDRVIRLEEFVKGKRSIDLRPNEIVVETTFRELPENARCAFEKVGMRSSLITAFVNCAVYLKLAKTGQIEDIRLGFNRVSSKIPSRARKTEEILRAQKLDGKILADAEATLSHELQLSSDFRASEEYRVETACVIFKRALTRCAVELGEKTIV
ncbi:MAG TPA: FAD binding domain-containing protein [Terriglobales bacterium]|nr:FAD binding domain-containing protein [Terriglobales bacterium]